MKITSDGLSAIPLWINGHAYLTVTEGFFVASDPRSGEPVRRVPLCGAPEVEAAVASACGALNGWSALTVAERQVYLLALAEALEGYAAHFAKLLQQETGASETEALAEVAAAVAALRHGRSGQGGVVAVVIAAGRPLAALAECIAPALRAGAVVICKPSPQASGAALALCELTGRSHWPVGSINLLQGDTAAIDALCAHPNVSRLDYRGDVGLGERVRAIAAKHGKAVNGGDD